jgi:hypothetical protein
VSRTSLLSIVSVTLVAIGTAYWIHAREGRKPWPKPTPPPPPSPIYHESNEYVPNEDEIAREAAEHTAHLEAQIEAAVLGNDPERHVAAYVFMLPELLQVEPQRVVSLFARLAPGHGRNRLRAEISRHWAVMDLRAAAQWLNSLDEPDRRAGAKVVIATLMPIDPLQATAFLKELGTAEDPKDWLTAR